MWYELRYYLRKFADIFLLEDYVSSSFIFDCVIVLMIACRVGKRDDDLLYSKYLDLGKSRGTSSCDRKIRFWEKGSDIFLWYPLYCMKMFHRIKFLFHWPVKFSKTDYPFEIAMIRKLFLNRFKYNLRSLTSTYYEYVWKFCCPRYRVFFWIPFSYICEYRMDDLSDDDCFPFLKKWICFLKTEEYPFRDHSQKFIGSSRNGIRLMDIEIYMKYPSCESNRYWTRSTFWKNTGFWNIFSLQSSDYSYCCEYSFYENKWIEKDFKRSCSVKFQCRNRIKIDSLFFGSFFFTRLISSYPNKISFRKNMILNEIFYKGNDWLDMPTSSTSYKDDFFILRKFFCYFLIHDIY